MTPCGRARSTAGRFGCRCEAALNGFDVSYRGVETRAFVYTEREAAAARLMPIKQVADSGKAVRCPMPGLVISIAVREGQEVKAGETLAVVEAMKMENVLRAERDGIGEGHQGQARRQSCRGRGDHGVCVIRPRPAVSPQAPASFALLTE